MNFRQTLRENYTKWNEKEYIFEKIDGHYRAITYGKFLENAWGLANHLRELGLSGKKIMLYGENSSRLMAADLAVLTSVGISVWVSKEWPEAEVLDAVKFLEVACLIYGAEKEEIVQNLRRKCPELICISTETFDEIGKSEELEKERESDCNVCCKIVFSSGTTAAPKAVMLSEKNIFAGLEPLYRRCPFGESDVDYLFLPLNHTYGGIYNFLYSLVFGFSIYLCSDITKMTQEILEVNPTLFCGVPLIYRRFYEAYGENIGKAFGSRIQYLFCGGASFDESLRRAYCESGFHLMDAYALSETASTFSIQYPDDRDLSTVGTVAENLDVKIINADEMGCGEIVVKGDSVFLGYANEPKLTELAFTEDGYFKTGDLGYLRPDVVHGGHKLYLTGRLKKQLIGENGENVEQAPIEAMIEEADENINKALLYLKNERIGCHLYLKKQEEKDWDRFFARINTKLPRYAHITFYDVVVDSVETRLKQV